MRKVDYFISSHHFDFWAFVSFHCNEVEQISELKKNKQEGRQHEAIFVASLDLLMVKL